MARERFTPGKLQEKEEETRCPQCDYAVDIEDTVCPLCCKSINVLYEDIV